MPTKQISNPKITSVFDYIVEVEGEFPYRQRQMFIATKNPDVKLILINATETKAYLLANDKSDILKIGDEIAEYKAETKIATSNDYFGKIINIDGNIIYPTPTETTKIKKGNRTHPIFNLAHDLMTVKTLNEQLYTGVVAIDLLIPIGKGQRELIIGDRQTGKTHIAINTIINQSKNDVKCIYVAIGQKKEAISRIYATLKEHDAIKNTIILDAPATSVYEQYLAPYIGMAHAENLSYENDVLIIFDDLTKHANIFREIALLTDRPVGKEAMPGDMFFAHSSLLERAGSFVDRKTITALPILQTIDNDITSLISSNVISMTDGQIVTSTDLFASGKLPAIDIGLSVSRTGSSVQSKTLTRIAGEVGKIYKTYKSHLKLASLDYEFNKETSLLLYKGKMIDKMFMQRGFSLYSHRFVLLTSKLISWTILRGIRDDQKALMFINTLIDTNAEAKKAFESIKDGKDYDDDIMKNYFAYALKQYSDYVGLKWDVECKYEFIAFEKDYLKKVAELLGDK
ncbi:ATP synthase F0F1 subunit alpha [Metamycoplasma arthritidis]|uniref:ATP synthase subunit A n=1 Tax=Metamycoplasma arthritidis (strain 158L3-1) TaxID=243272 RepID=B3PMB0_META1|nr:ATP F0F1 synthase subunit alpha [Metamycoplasma arthritidis]ACF07162.1 ATP synthase subunit A [Metamycoplasma arthritidis 158L3-1]VEU78687.1 ATP synthase F0F1 subunit alpha [Metamycoplasma arthritidis]